LLNKHDGLVAMLTNDEFYYLKIEITSMLLFITILNANPQGCTETALTRRALATASKKQLKQFISNLPFKFAAWPELFVRTEVVGANSAIMFCTASAKMKMLIIIIWANVWRLIDALTEANNLFSKAYGIHLHH